MKPFPFKHVFCQYFSLKRKCKTNYLFFPALKFYTTFLNDFSFSLQTETIQGLDGCASLLRDILRNEDSGFIF